MVTANGTVDLYVASS